MKYILNASLFLILFCCTATSFANPGDTTVVLTSPVLNADNSTSFDTLIVLPTAKTYRKIYLVYTLNSHACASGSTYCHQWDYIGNVTLKSPHGDTVDLARIITPFATSGWSRFRAPRSGLRIIYLMLPTLLHYCRIVSLSTVPLVWALRVMVSIRNLFL